MNLNIDLIEAIALGHDIGHTPFGHAGERFLNILFQENTGRYFNHNVHSVRVLDTLFARNLSLQTLDGFLCHNGEYELKEYRPVRLTDFSDFDKNVENCYIDKSNINKLIPSTLEGCVVRICDMIAYLGKDRQDARNANLLQGTQNFTKGTIGVENAEIINNLVVNIVENSYEKDCII
ncbi:MAG: HD domain-containing protein, partial [Oscillospiraceae bacterium]